MKRDTRKSLPKAGSQPQKKKSSKVRRKKKTARLPKDEQSDHRWTFLSNHAHVLICLAREPNMRLREVAERIGITERAVQNILLDLEREDLLRRYREGRRNTYELSLDQPLRHPIEKHRNVGDLVRLILD